MKPRTLKPTILRAAGTFPAIVITGPRQSGKTTLLKALTAGTHGFVSLENPDVRARALADPNAFLAQNKPPVVIDEIQYVPELLSYIKTRIDEDRKPGHWIFTGSQNFTLMRGVSQSLAGRAAVLSLLPFSVTEVLDRGGAALDTAALLAGADLDPQPPAGLDLAGAILRGGYPEPACNPAVDMDLWCGSYIATYLERDVRNLAQVADLRQFERFLGLCAARTGQILNMSELSRDLGLSVPTVQRWLAILEASYQVFLLPPYHRNIGKRLRKSPKLYFTDTALAAYLLGLRTPEVLLRSPSFGHLFETMVVVDFWKRALHCGQRPALYYMRTVDGLEVDLAVESEQRLHLFEIKSAMTITPRHAAPLVRFLGALGPAAAGAAVISAAEESFALQAGVRNRPWLDVLGR